MRGAGGDAEAQSALAESGLAQDLLQLQHIAERLCVPVIAAGFCRSYAEVDTRWPSLRSPCQAQQVIAADVE